MPGEYFGKKQHHANRDHSNERPARKMQLQDREQINSYPEPSAHSSSDNCRPTSRHLYNGQMQFLPNSFYYSNRIHSYLPKYQESGYLCNREFNGGPYSNVGRRPIDRDTPDEFELSLQLGLAVLQSFPRPCSRELQIDFVDRALEYWLRYTENQNCQRANEAAGESGPTQDGCRVWGTESDDYVITRGDGGARNAESSEILCRHARNSVGVDARRNVPSRGKVQPTTPGIDAGWEDTSDDGGSSSTLSELESSESSVSGSLENLKLS